MRISIWLLITASLLVSISAWADHRKVLMLETMPVPVITEHSQAIAEAFTEMGHRQGHDITVEILSAEGDKNRAINLLTAALAEGKPDLVITLATLATQAGVEILAGTDIPILFGLVSDPVGSGIVQEIGVPSNSNISGIVHTQQRQTKLEMVQRILMASGYEAPVSIGVVSSDYPSAIGDLEALREVTADMEFIRFVPYQFPYKPVPDGLPEMLENTQTGVDALRDQVDFLWQVTGPMAELAAPTKILIDSGIPLILGHTATAVEMGAVMSVSTDKLDTAKQIVERANLIFQGTDVGSLPVVLPRKFKLHINMDAAKQHNLHVPSHLLMIAGDNLIY